MRTLEKILVLFLMILLIFSAVQKEFKVINIRDLDGDFVLANKPELNLNDWIQGTFQPAFESYIDDHIGFRSFLVRLNNQMDFSLYGIPHAEGIVVGKNNQMIEYDYIREFIGNDFIGENAIDRKMRKLKFLQQYLKKEKDIDLILVFEPGKASYYPEYIPDRYFIDKREKRNSKVFRQKANEYEVKYLDFDRWYRNDLKGKHPYPLYPPHGIHWSIYGMTFAADSLLKYIEAVRQINMVDAIIDNLKIEIHANRADYDAGRALNLLFRLPETDSLAYPVYAFSDTIGKTKPMVLTIADSYYWNIINTNIPKHVFANEAFWYFNSAIYPDTYVKPLSVDDVNIKDEIEKQDVILLMVTGRFLYRFGWTFIEKGYNLYAPQSEFDKAEQYAEGIRSYSEWFDQEVKSARIKRISLEENIAIDAKYVYQTTELESSLTYYGTEYFETQIRHNKAHLALILEKAKQQNLSPDSLLFIEADYAFKMQYPIIHKKFHAIQNAKNRIVNDSILLSQSLQKAKRYYLNLEEILQITAEEMVANEID